jgi:CopG family nickel-responsive transcriptional regulator
MSKIERIGVSLDKNLLAEFDKIITKKGYKNRSEAIRDLIRDKLSQVHLSNPKTRAVAVICLVYNHHSTKLMEKLTHLQHSHLLQSISTLHIHIDSRDCMEIIVLKGRVSEIKKTAEKITSFKDVKLGKINLMSTEVI